ncbi:hypothetical protein D210916BOD24_27340 [Alteromonas sp. D210916BOD_24]|uniref:glycosyltransferase family 2 protein n=1 Tax=Alteromonas sp. D210916BOD_24 TaxID=3157618 RepID=UPI00399CA4EC
MKKVKSLVKKLLGRNHTAPYTIDLVQRTSTGFCIIGWYFTNDVSSLNIKAKNGTSVDTTLLKISRDDVFAVTNKKAAGFELHVHTSDSTDQFYLIFETSNGSKQVTIPSPNGAIDEPDVKSKIESTTLNRSDVKAACEYAIETPTHFFVGGWVLDEKEAKSFYLVDRRNKTLATFEDGIRIQRKDIIETFGESSASRGAGLNYLFKKVEDYSSETTGQHIRLCFTLNGKDVTVPVDTIYPATQDSVTNAKRLLNAWQPSAPSHLKKADMFSQILRDAFPATLTASAVRHDFNKQPSTPVASLIIPLYGRYDFMRYQLSHFGRYKQTHNCEVIYVVDDPSIANEVMKLAREMEIVSTQPFSVLQLSQNLGFGKANNIGVQYANAEIIALINSDILPKTTDWLDKLIDTARQPDAGIVGARLLFEDESLQHDGMAPMTVNEYPGLLFNDHPKKGWPKSLAPFESAVEPCPLITAACWVMQKSLYQQLNGFDPEYVLGDFEDSDLCLRMLELGRTNYIRRDVELYHLERQSQNLVPPGRWKHNITILNAVYFNKKWKTTLEHMEKVNA